jgi:hypothetical protein
MKKVFKFVVELEVDCNGDPNDDLDDLSLNVCHGIGKYVMKGVIKNDLCWEFDKDHLVKKVVSSPLNGDIYDKYGRQDYPRTRVSRSPLQHRNGWQALRGRRSQQHRGHAHERAAQPQRIPWL